MACFVHPHSQVSLMKKVHVPGLTWRLRLRRLWLNLFPPEFIHHPDDLDAYPRNEATILKALLAGESKQIALLGQLGIPVPTVARPLKITPHLSTVYELRIDNPAYDFPPHLLFRARLPLAPGASPYTTKPETAVYFFAADEATIAEAEALLKEQGLLEVARRFPGRWFNRDPYASLKPGGQVRIGLTHPTQDIAVNTFLRLFEERTLPLEAVPGYPLSDLEQMQRRLDFYASFAADTWQPSLTGLLRYDEENRRPPAVPDSVLFALPLSQPAFSTEAVSLKILPSGDAPQALMQSFLMSLRPAEHPVAFELIDDGRSAYFQMSCAPDDTTLVARQLRLHFPNFSFEEYAGAAAAPLPGISVKPAALFQPLRPLNDFSLDPLGQLFAVLDEAPPDTVTALQVLFAPLPDAALLTVTDHLQKRHEERPDAELSGRIKQGVHKLPAWQAVVRLLCSSPEVLSRLKAEYVGQYQVAGHPLIFTEERAAITRRDMRNWTLLSSAELAAFAHFPTSEKLV